VNIFLFIFLSLSIQAHEKLIWESPFRPQAEKWSRFVHHLISTEASEILRAKDWKKFCPRYDSLNFSQKVNAAGQLIAAISRYESNFNPLARFREPGMGTDPVTGLPVYSEGLLQLSYQDVIWAPYCGFDWEQDKQLMLTDPQKTILDPFINLDCGVRILSNQVHRRGLIILGSGAYWAVIKSNSAHQKIPEIESIVSSLKICR
jgi:hypothetical protein